MRVVGASRLGGEPYYRLRLRSQVRPGPLVFIGVLAAAGVALDLRSRDQAYDDREAFSKRLAAAELARPDDSPEITLAETDHGEPPGALARQRIAITRVIVSKTAIRVPLADLTLPLPPDDRELLIRPLAHALRWTNERFREVEPDIFASGVLLTIDRDVPYRIVERVAYTAGQNAMALAFVGRHEGKVVEFTEPQPDHWPVRFRVKLTARSDFAALTEEGNRWKAASPENVAEDSALITAEPDVPYQELLRAEAALRVEGTFPSAHWGIDRGQ